MAAKKICALISTLVTIATAGNLRLAAAEGPLSPSQLNGAMARYNGQHVLVRGFVMLGPEGHVLYQSKALHDQASEKWNSGKSDFDPKQYEKYCLTIANPSFIKQMLHGKSQGAFIVTGKFISDYLDGHTIDLGACPLPSAIILDGAKQSR